MTSNLTKKWLQDQTTASLLGLMLDLGANIAHNANATKKEIKIVEWVGGIIYDRTGEKRFEGDKFYSQLWGND